jgi:undecaprenyl-diphosphatase
LLACAAACLSLFVGLAVATCSGAVGSFDEWVRSGIHQFASADLTLLASAVTRLGSVAVIATLFGVAFVGFYASGRRRAALALAVVMAGAVVLENALKYALHRARPEPFFGTAPESYSFPSGHTLFSACFYGVLAWIFAARTQNVGARAATWTASLVLIAAIGLSRVYLGVHYPTDVIAGYLVAAFWITGLLASRSGREDGQRHRIVMRERAHPVRPRAARIGAGRGAASQEWRGSGLLPLWQGWSDRARIEAAHRPKA